MPPPPPPVTPRPLRVLLIEDHDDSRIALARLLRQYATDVRAAGSCAGARALAAAPAGPPEVIVGDLGLPDGDGCDLLIELKKLYGCPTVALTGHATDADAERCRAAGVDRHLAKPVVVLHLWAAIQDLLGR